MKRSSHYDKCTKADYRALFASSRESLHWLCYTLTGDERLIDKVLHAALERCLKSADHVARERMVSWARRLIVGVCIEIALPWAPNIVQHAHLLAPFGTSVLDLIDVTALLSLPADLLQQKLLRLDALSRFVFVLRAIEGYSRRDTSLLLNVDDRTCEWIYVGAADAMNVKPTDAACCAAYATDFGTWFFPAIETTQILDY